jgi:hypothetical protein
MDVRVPAVGEATLRGAAQMAARAVGIASAVGRGASADECRHAPNPEAQRVYEMLALRRDGIYAAQLRLAEDGLTTPLWWPPGAGGRATPQGAPGPVRPGAGGIPALPQTDLDLRMWTG